jgi:hypothetical protein
MANFSLLKETQRAVETRVTGRRRPSFEKIGGNVGGDGASLNPWKRRDSARIIASVQKSIAPGDGQAKVKTISTCHRLSFQPKVVFREGCFAVLR